MTSTGHLLVAMPTKQEKKKVENTPNVLYESAINISFKRNRKRNIKTVQLAYTEEKQIQYRENNCDTVDADYTDLIPARVMSQWHTASKNMENVYTFINNDLELNIGTNKVSEVGSSFKDFEGALIELEKVLTTKYEKVLNSGKGSPAVVILIPELVKNFINILLEHRSKYIPSDNDYVFAINGSRIKWGKGDVTLRVLAKKVKLENPAAFISNKLRKHICHSYNQYMFLIVQCKLPVEIYQTAKVSKLLLMMEKVPGERYEGLPCSLLYCSVCNKRMWNADSFQKHVDGKAHRQMMRNVEHGFRIHVKFLRTHTSLLEMNKTIEIERKNRKFQNYHSLDQEERTHCNMCDGTFLGTFIAHRMSEEHRRLKRFLHPKCSYCLQKFSSRIEWVYHKFTKDHLEKVNKFINTNASKENEAPIIEEAAEINIDLLLENVLKPEAEKPILELSENLKNLHKKLPLYNPTRKVAKENVKPTSGIYCNLCKLFFTKETVAKEHLLTKNHYRAFVNAMKCEFKKSNDKEREIKDQNDSEEARQINVTSFYNISDNEKFAQTDEN
ncbi:hypothetical protein FQA39_LY09137 [Lamprigera yunnana]|nr:hypothetical protein FQA39_LY09137 [Lamprigera yunnana]